MKTQLPVNIKPLNPDLEIMKNGLLEVKTPLIWEPSSTNFHLDGLFSEGIFGQIGTPERFSRLGFINLYTQVITPKAFRDILALKSAYEEILTGRTFAKFDNKLKDFVICDKNTTGSDTGYNFFVTHLNDIVFPFTKSESRKYSIETIYKYKKHNCLLIDKALVLPAGLRDIKQNDDKVEIEEINKLYISILALSNELRTVVNSPSLIRLYDGVRYQLQTKIYDLYLNHKTFFEGKSGFAQKRFARRGLAYGARNVISGATLQGSHPDDPQFMKHNEISVGLFQCLKMYQPLIINQIRSLFYGQIFSPGVLRVTGINPRNKMIEYVDVNNKEIDRMLSSESLESLINTFKNTHMRTNPVSFFSESGDTYWLFLVYDTGDKIYILRNIDDFTTFMKNKNIDVDKSKIRPLTYLEMFYLE